MSGVYISWPFCPHKCTFCNFASNVFPRGLEQEYAKVLAEELRSQHWPWIPGTVYFGGGTPSMMETAVLEDLLAAIPGKPWKEATLEALPGHVTLAQASRWRRAGIDRVSFGVQSFVPEEVGGTGRRHSAEDVERDFNVMRAAGIGNLCLDLIAGLPHQTPASWTASLDWVERLQPKHVSVYLLEVDEDSRLGLEVLQGGSRYGAAHVPDDSVQADLYETAVERLDAMGLKRYEISNFARPGFESLHNSKYWKLAPYLGFGADAHSFDGVTRWSSVESPQEYVAGASTRIDEKPARLDEERFFLGLRLLEGVAAGSNEFAAEIESLRVKGLLETHAGRLRLTSRGVLLSNEVFQEFIRT